MTDSPAKRRKVRSDSDGDWIWIEPGDGHVPELTVHEGQPYRIGFVHFPDRPAEDETPDPFAKWREFRGIE